MFNAEIRGNATPSAVITRRRSAFSSLSKHTCLLPRLPKSFSLGERRKTVGRKKDVLSKKRQGECCQQSFLSDLCSFEAGRGIGAVGYCRLYTVSVVEQRGISVLPNRTN